MSKVEEAIELAHISCRGRLVRSAVHSFLGTDDGYMTDGEYDMYETLAENGIGLIITGHSCISPSGRANEEQINIYDDVYIPQFARAARLVQERGARFVVQLSHAGPRSIGVKDLADVVARPLKKNRQARALTHEDIQLIERDFIAAAVRVQRSGADGVQLHAAHSYLLSRFVDRTFNQRIDEYGGSVENRFRIVENILRGIRKACGEAFPVLVKINSDSKTEDAAYEKDLLWMLQRMKELGVELVELSGVDFINQPKDGRLYYLERAARLRRAVNIPMSIVGGVRALADIEKALACGMDMVSMGRPLVCEPDILPRLLAGQEQSSCLCCNRCFVLPHMHAGMRCIWQRKLKKRA